MVIIPARNGVQLRFETADWQADRALRFQTELKFLIPSHGWSFDRRTKTWFVHSDYVYVIDFLKARYFTRTKAQQSLFDEAA